MSTARDKANSTAVANYVASNASTIKASIDKYPSCQRVTRYMHILRVVSNSPSSDAAIAALSPLLVSELKQTRNTTQYRAFTEYCISKQIAVSLDTDWIAAKDRQTAADLDKLQQSLSQAQSNFSKEGIRTTLMQLAELYFSRGDSVNALKHVHRAHENCITPEQHVACSFLGLQIIYFSVDTQQLPIPLSDPSSPHMPQGYPSLQQQQQVGAAQTFVQHLEKAARETSSVEDFATAQIAMGLIQLGRKEYAAASECFTNLRAVGREVKMTLKFECITVPLMNPNDLALIAAITTLATTNRPDLRKFVSNPDFKAVLENDAELGTALTTFFDRQYTQSLALLENFRVRLLLDPFFEPHADKLLRLIRRQAIRHYVAPYATIDLRKMSEVFCTSVPELEEEVTSMIIHDKEISVRIDKSRNALQALSTDPAKFSVSQVVSVGREYILESEMALRTLSMLRHGVCLQQPPEQGIDF